MTTEQLWHVLGKLRGLLLEERPEVFPKRMAQQWLVQAEFLPPASVQYYHLAWMIEEIMRFWLHGRREKAMRWLGFVQGGLWSLHLVSIEELREMNR